MAMEQEEEWPDLSVGAYLYKFLYIESCAIYLNFILFLFLVYQQLNKKELVFRPKKLTISKDITAKPCDICAVGFDRTYEYPERGMSVISCFGCGLSCHLYCYGIETQIEINEIPNNQGYFVCDRCKVNHKTDQVCILCHEKQGLKKQLQDSKEFVHPSCALMSKQIELTSFTKMSFKKSSGQMLQEECSICRHKGASIKCDECDKSAHMGCIINKINSIGGFVLQYVEESDRESVWEWQINHSKLFSSGSVRGSCSHIEDTVKSQVKAIMEQYNAIQQEDINVDVDQLFDSFIKQDKIEEEKEQINYKLFPNRSIFKFRCPSHRKPEEFCSCKLVSQSEMIQCNTCAEWYHFDCLMTEEEYQVQSQMEIFYCKYCQEWTSNKLNKILKFDVVRTIQELIPSYQLQTMLNLIILGIYCERSFSYLSQRYNDQLFDVVESLLSNLPFHQALSEQVSQLKQKAYVTEFMKFLLKNSNYRVKNAWVVLTQMDEYGTPIQQNITQNNNLRGRLKKVIELFKDYDECQFYIDLNAQLTKVQYAYDIIQSKTKITSSQLNELSNETYNEFNWFLDQKIKYDDWKNKLSNAFKNTKKKCYEYTESIESEEGIDSFEALMEFLHIEENIDSRHKFYQVIGRGKMWLNSIKINHQQMKQYIEEGEQFIFEIEWLYYLKRELDQGEDLRKQAQEIELSLNNQDEISNLLDQIEKNTINHGDFKDLYEFFLELDEYGDYIDQLREIQLDRDEAESDVQGPQDLNICISEEHLQTIKDLHKKVQGSEEDMKLIELIQNNLMETRQKFRKMIQTKGLNESMRKEYFLELQMNKLFNFPEIAILQNRLDTYKEIERIKNSKQQTLQQLENCLLQARENQFDEKLILYFETEINKCYKLKQRINEVLSQTIFNQLELEQAKELVSEINAGKIQLEEKPLLQSIAKAIGFVDTLYDFYIRNKSPDHEMEIEFDKKLDLDYKLNQIQNPSKILFKQNDQFILELEAIINKNITILDERIKAIYQQYSDFLWEKQWQEVSQLWKNKQEISIGQIEAIFKKEKEEIKEFRECFHYNQGIMSALSSSIQTLLIQPVDQMFVFDWQQKYNSLTLSIRGGVWDQLKIYNLWVTVMLKYFEIVSVPKCTYESLKLMQEIIVLSHIPKQSWIWSVVQSRITNFNLLVERLKEYNQRKQQQMEKTKSKKELTRIKIGYALRDAQQLDMDLQQCFINHEFISAEFYSDYNQILSVRQALAESQDENPTQLYQKIVQCFIFDQRTTEQLKMKIYSNKLKDVISGKKVVEYQKLKKQYQVLMQLLENYGLQSEIEQYSELNNTLNKAEKVQNLLQRMRSNTAYTYEELCEAQNLLKELESVNIDNSFEIEAKYQDCQRVLNQIEEVKNSNMKCKEQTINIIQDKLINTPLNEQKAMVNKWVEEARSIEQQFKSLRNIISKQKANPNGKELSELTKNFCQKYDQSLVMNSEADDFIKQYNEFNKKLEFIENNLDDEGVYSTLNDLLTIFRWGDRYERVKIGLWIRQVTKFKDDKSIKWGITQLRTQLMQGYEIIESLLTYGPKQTLDKLKAPLVYLEQMITKVHEHFRSSQFNDLSAGQIVEGKVDTYELQIELQHLTHTEKMNRLKELEPKRPFDDLKKFQERKTRTTLHQQQKKPERIHNDEVEVRKKTKVHIQREEKQVSPKLREQKKRELFEAMSYNKVFSKKGQQYIEMKVKEMENFEFGEHNLQSQQYTEKMDGLIFTLKELQKYPSCSIQLQRKNFSQESLNVMMKKSGSSRLLQTMEDQLIIKQSKVKDKNNINNNSYNPLAPYCGDSKLQITNIKTIKPQRPSQQQQLSQPQQLDLLSKIVKDQIIEQPQPQFQQLLTQTPSQIIQEQQTKSEIHQLSNQTKSKFNQSPLNPSRSSIDNSLYKKDSSSLSDFNEQSQQKAILYDPDAQEEVQQQIQPKIQSLQFGDKLYKLGKKYKVLLVEKQYNLELYCQMEEQKFKYINKISSELKQLKQYNAQSVIKNIETLSLKQDFILICGQVLPEKYSELSEINRLADKLRAEQHIYQQNIQFEGIYITLCHYEQLSQSALFSNFKPQEIVTEKQFQRKENGIWKYWGNAQSRLCFIIYNKSIRAASLSSFSPIEYDQVKNIIKSKDVQRWAEAKISEYKKSKQQQQASQKLELEPVTSEDEANNKNNQNENENDRDKNQNEEFDILLDQLRGNEEIMKQLYSKDNQFL